MSYRTSTISHIQLFVLISQLIGQACVVLLLAVAFQSSLLLFNHLFIIVALPIYTRDYQHYFDMLIEASCSSWASRSLFLRS